MFIEARDGHVHHRWDAAIPPIVEVEPGAIVTIETRTGDDGQLQPGDRPEALERLDFGRLHALTGPIAVRGAKPGQLLVVDVLRLRGRVSHFTERRSTTFAETKELVAGFWLRGREQAASLA